MLSKLKKKIKNPSENIAQKYRQEKQSLHKIISSIKRKKPKNLDEKFAGLHDKIFSEIDCLTCANCCKTTSPMLFEKDIERLSQFLNIKPGQFIEKYLFMDTDGIYAFRITPCPFLGTDNYCSVYEHRPKACREYPHTNQRKMHTLLNLAEKNAEICPAVLEIIKQFPV